MDLNPLKNRVVNDMKEIAGALGRAWNFPPRFNLAVGVVMAVDYDRIRQSLRVLFSTLPGERIMRENFGCDLNQFMFMNMGDELFARISDRIDEAIRQYEPRVEPLSVNVERHALEPYRLQVQVIYRVRGSSEIQQLSGQMNLNRGNSWGGAWVS